MRVLEVVVPIFGAACAFASQLPLTPLTTCTTNNTSVNNVDSGSPSTRLQNKRTMLVDWRSDDFAFKTGPDVFSPQDLIELPRPGSGSANPKGDLALVSVNTYSFKDKK